MLLQPSYVQAIPSILSTLFSYHRVNRTEHLTSFSFPSKPQVCIVYYNPQRPSSTYFHAYNRQIRRKPPTMRLNPGRLVLYGTLFSTSTVLGCVYFHAMINNVVEEPNKVIGGMFTDMDAGVLCTPTDLPRGFMTTPPSPAYFNWYWKCTSGNEDAKYYLNVFSYTDTSPALTSQTITAYYGSYGSNRLNTQLAQVGGGLYPPSHVPACGSAFTGFASGTSFIDPLTLSAGTSCPSTIENVRSTSWTANCASTATGVLPPSAYTTS